MIEDGLKRPSFRQTLRPVAPELGEGRFPSPGKRNVVREVVVRNGLEVLPVKERNARPVRAETGRRVLRLAVGVRELIAQVAQTADFTRPASQTDFHGVV